MGAWEPDQSPWRVHADRVPRERSEQWAVERVVLEGIRPAQVSEACRDSTRIYSTRARLPSAEAGTSFVMGTSSTLFNAGLLALNSTNNTAILINAINSVLSVIGENQNDIALYPNSFANWTAQPNPVSGQRVRVLLRIALEMAPCSSLPFDSGDASVHDLRLQYCYCIVE